jgi:hypothetical protein
MLPSLFNINNKVLFTTLKTVKFNSSLYNSFFLRHSYYLPIYPLVSQVVFSYTSLQQKSSMHFFNLVCVMCANVIFCNSALSLPASLPPSITTLAVQKWFEIFQYYMFKILQYFICHDAGS